MKNECKKTDRRDFLKMSAVLAALTGLPAEALADINLRYACKGEVHKDFHASILDGVNYMLDNYGEESIRRVLFTTGTKVYRQMREKLMAGDTSELIEWWRYYMDREGGKYAIEENVDGTAVLTVSDCPAQRHLQKRKIGGGGRTCWATDVLNEAFCSDSPYEIVLERTGEFSCRQVLRRKLPACLTGRIDGSVRYEGLAKNLKKAFSFLRETDLSTLPNGRTAVDGEEVFVNVADVMLKPWDPSARGEVHRRYADIFVPLTGSETIGCVSDTGCVRKLNVAFESGKDIAIPEGLEYGKTTVSPGEFALFLPPWGAHVPGRTDGPSRQIRRAVVKVLVG